MSGSFILRHWINWFYLCKDSHAAGEHSIWMSWKQFEFGFTAHYHAGEVWVIWFDRAESWCMWILQALRNPVSECFSSGHRTGVKAKPCLYYWGQITSTPGAQSSNVGGSLVLGCWWGTCIIMGHFFCCRGPSLPTSRSGCCRLWAVSLSATSYSRCVGMPAGVRSSGTRLWAWGDGFSA